MAKSPTKPSTPKLSDLAKHVVAPKGVVSTGWPAVEAKCLELGVRFRPWQPGVGRLILSKRADGKYASTIGGTGMSIPRQVGKTFLVGAIVFALCLLRPNLTVIWTAHRLRTAEETFGKMRAFAKRKRIAPHVLKIVLGSGEEAILFRNGSRILFGAREGGFGVGFDEIDVLIFDEAQRLKASALDDMVPATNQSRQSSGALLLFMGTPPRPTDNGEVFTRMRTEALSGEDDDTGWVEFGADDEYGPTLPPEPLIEADWVQVAKANPSYPQDTPREAILRMRKKLGPDSFLREGLGKWDDVHASRGVIDMPTWSALKVQANDEPAKATVVVDVAPDLDWTSVALGSEGPNGRTLILSDRREGRREGTAGTVERVVALSETLADVVEVALTPTARLFSAGLTKAKVEHKLLTNADLGLACVWTQEAIRNATVAHVGQQELNDAVRNATTRFVGDTQHWDRRDRRVDISTLVAASVAAHRWALLTAVPERPPLPPVRETTALVTSGPEIAHVGF